MIRRSPTRIELRLDDLQEYEVIKKEREAVKSCEKASAFNPPSWGGKAQQSEIQERIGYVPQPSSHLAQSRPNI
uniref:Anaphase-promoting complex subunit CDC26 n=1 Tax=Bracon brevicornis TaxID=1563983 RepID=A0A6V7LB43_9HYME